MDRKTGQETKRKPRTVDSFDNKNIKTCTLLLRCNINRAKNSVVEILHRFCRIQNVHHFGAISLLIKH